MRKENDYYKTLEVHPEASDEVIKKAYKALAVRYHPDISEKTARKMQEVNLAYQVLSDPEKRRLYDQKLTKKTDASQLMDIASILIYTFFLIGLAKFIFKAFPALLLIFVPLGLLAIFVRHPKTVAKIYVAILKPSQK